MIDPSLDDSLIRRALSRLGAVARIGAVSPTPPSPQVDPARGTDPRWEDLPRPDPASMSIADIVQFRELVYGSEPRGDGGAGLGDHMLQAGPQAPATPADRIVGTLQHLRGVHGL